MLAVWLVTASLLGSIEGEGSYKLRNILFLGTFSVTKVKVLKTVGQEIALKS